MPWEPGRPDETPTPAAERRLWVLVKSARSATASVRPHPLGVELIIRVASELVWSRAIKPDDETTVDAEADAAREAFIGRGWQPAE